MLSFKMYSLTHRSVKRFAVSRCSDKKHQLLTTSPIKTGALLPAASSRGKPVFLLFGCRCFHNFLRSPIRQVIGALFGMFFFSIQSLSQKIMPSAVEPTTIVCGDSPKRLGWREGENTTSITYVDRSFKGLLGFPCGHLRWRNYNVWLGGQLQWRRSGLKVLFWAPNKSPYS